MSEILVIGGLCVFAVVFFMILGALCLMKPREPAKAVSCWIVAVIFGIVATTQFVKAYTVSAVQERGSSNGNSP